MFILVINLDRHRLRLERMSAQLAASGLAFERLRAIDGSELSDADLAGVVSPTQLQTLSRSEVACFLSHRAAWQRFLASDEPLCCVLEDDVRLAADFGPALSAAPAWTSLPHDVIKIETMRQRVWVRRRKRACFPGYALSELRSCHHGTAGYIVNREGARRLLDLTERMDGPIDNLIFDRAIAASPRLRVLQLQPALCIQEDALVAVLPESEFRSSITPDRERLLRPGIKRKGLAKLLQEVARPFRRLFSLPARLGLERVMVGFDETHMLRPDVVFPVESAARSR